MTPVRGTSRNAENPGPSCGPVPVFGRGNVDMREQPSMRPVLACVRTYVVTALGSAARGAAAATRDRMRPDAARAAVFGAAGRADRRSGARPRMRAELSAGAG